MTVLAGVGILQRDWISLLVRVPDRRHGTSLLVGDVIRAVDAVDVVPLEKRIPGRELRDLGCQSARSYLLISLCVPRIPSTALNSRFARLALRPW